MSDGEAEIDPALANKGVPIDSRSASVSAPTARVPRSEAKQLVAHATLFLYAPFCALRCIGKDAISCQFGKGNRSLEE